MEREPLAKKLEPKTLNDVLGQKHLIGKGAILRNLVAKKKLSFNDFIWKTRNWKDFYC